MKKFHYFVRYAQAQQTSKSATFELVFLSLEFYSLGIYTIRQSFHRAFEETLPF